MARLCWANATHALFPSGTERIQVHRLTMSLPRLRVAVRVEGVGVG